ncbi:MAG: ATP-binding protein [bacterium]
MFYIINAVYRNYIAIVVLCVLVLIAAVTARVVFDMLGYEQRARRKAEKAAGRHLNSLTRAKNALSRERDRLNAVLSSMGEGLIVCDSQGIILLMNQIAGMLLRITPNDSIGKNIKQVAIFYKQKIGDKKKKNIDLVQKVIKNTDIITVTPIEKMFCYSIVSQVIFPVAVVAAPLFQGKDNGGAIILMRDGSKELKIDQAKTEFVSLASHQLRTPLSTMNWYAEMLLLGDAGKLKAEQRDFVEEIHRSNKRMTDLVNGLLDVSRIELGTFSIEPEPIDYSKIAKRVIHDFKNQIETKKIFLSTEFDKKIPLLLGDVKLLEIIIQNLLSNAIKYTPEKGHVEMQIKRAPDYQVSENDKILISIADDGYGIPKAEQNQVFSKLFRASNIVVLDTQGTGLGLYIVKSILNDAGGEISFESPVMGQKNGTKFTITFPMTGMKAKNGTKKLT